MDKYVAFRGPFRSRGEWFSAKRAPVRMGGSALGETSERPPPHGGSMDLGFGPIRFPVEPTWLLFAGGLGALLVLITSWALGRPRTERGVVKSAVTLPQPPKPEPVTFVGRANAVGLPAHLRLGVGLAGLQEPLQDVATEEAAGEPVTRCERLQQQESAHVGEPTLFVSRTPGLPSAVLVEALRSYVEQRAEASPCFWVHNFCMRPAGEGPSDHAWLRATVGAIRHTLLVLDESPANGTIPTLDSVRCCYELYHTARSGGRLSLAVPPEQQAAFEAVVRDDFGGMQMALSRVDVGGPSPPSDDAEQRLLAELRDEPGGLARVNRLVMGLLRSWLAAQGRELLDSLAPEERGLSPLIVPLGRLMHSTGDAVAARALLEEAHVTRREALGWRHADTRLAFDLLVGLLFEQGDLAASRQLQEEHLTACRELLGEKHPETLDAMCTLGTQLKELGNLNAALPLLEEALAGMRTTLGPKHTQTLEAVHRLGMLHFYARRLPRAKALLMEAIRGLGEARGPRHPDTLEAVANLGQLLFQEGHADGAFPLLKEALAGRRRAMGDLHPETIDSIGQLAALHRITGELEAAVELLQEGLARLKQIRAPRDQELRWAKDLVRVLDSAGDATASAAIRDQYGMLPPPPPPCRPQCGCHNCVRKRAAKNGNAHVATWVRVANALVMICGALLVLATPVVFPKAAASLGIW